MVEHIIYDRNLHLKRKTEKEKKYKGYNEEFAAADEETQEEATAELEEVSKETAEK